MSQHFHHHHHHYLHQQQQHHRITQTHTHTYTYTYTRLHKIGDWQLKQPWNDRVTCVTRQWKQKTLAQSHWGLL